MGSAFRGGIGFSIHEKCSLNPQKKQPSETLWASSRRPRRVDKRKGRDVNVRERGRLFRPGLRVFRAFRKRVAVFRSFERFVGMGNSVLRLRQSYLTKFSADLP